MMAEARISDILKQIAEEEAEARRIAEYGPGGGNPNATKEQQIEWKAACYIDKLEAEIARLREMNED